MIRRLDAQLSVLLTYKLACKLSLCGPQFTCAPAPKESDTDVLCFCPNENNLLEVINELSARGFRREGEEHYRDAASDFMSWRNSENINIIVTTSKMFFKNHKIATSICKQLNLLKKEDRIAVFQTLLYGCPYERASESQKYELLEGSK